jgi:hypothetical protein
MKSFAGFAFIAFLLPIRSPHVFSADLAFGPNQPFARPEYALAQARPGELHKIS